MESLAGLLSEIPPAPDPIPAAKSDVSGSATLAGGSAGPAGASPVASRHGESLFSQAAANSSASAPHAAPLPPLRRSRRRSKRSSGIMKWVVSLATYLLPTAAVVAVLIYRLGWDHAALLPGQPGAGDPVDQIGAGGRGSDSTQQLLISTEGGPGSVSSEGVVTEAGKPSRSSAVDGRNQSRPGESGWVANRSSADGKGTLIDNELPVDDSSRQMQEDQAVQARLDRAARLREFRALSGGESRAKDSQPAVPDDAILIDVPLDLHKEKVRVKVQANHPAVRLRVLGVDGLSGNMTTSPETGMLEPGQPVRMSFDDMPSFGIELRMLEPIQEGEESGQFVGEFMVTMRFRPTGGEPIGF
ncbi:MAG: hypothetical protein AAF989_11495, partial [Planctomycetota bacterium]